MDNAALYPRYRWVMAVLINLAAQLTHVVYVALSPLLVYLAEDFNISKAAAGYATTVHILSMGVFMFVGTILIGWIDNKRTQLLGIAVEILGVIMAFFSRSFGMLIFARVFTGMGHGISGACTNSVIAAWFPPKEKPIVITLDTLGYLAITMLSYTCIVPVFHAFGDSWRYTLLSMGGVLVVVELLWIFFAKDNHALNAYIKQRNQLEGKKTNAFSGMREALRRRDVWMYCLCCATYSVANIGITTYLPQFLQSVRSMSDAAASSVVGVASAIGVAATFVGGVVATALGRRKPIVLPCIAAGAAVMTITLTSTSVWTITICYTVFTILGSFRSPATGTIATELKNSSPALASSTSAMSYGMGYIGSFLASPLLAFSTSLFGEERSMLIFIPLLASSFVFAALMPETGPKRRQKAPENGV